MRTPNPFVVCSCIYAYCLEIAISPKWCAHLVLIAAKMHICMSSQQKDLVYALGQDVPKLVYAFWTCKPVFLTARILSLHKDLLPLINESDSITLRHYFVGD